mgnify:CR=1 FL=1
MTAMTKGYTALKLSDDSRAQILEAFPPQFSNVACDHITLNFGVDQSSPLPDGEHVIEIIGHAINKDGIEALVVTVNGQDTRKDGSPYHITLSYDPDKNAPASYDLNKPVEKRKERPFKPFHSNALISVDGYDPVVVDISIDTTPVFTPAETGQKNVKPAANNTAPKLSHG